MTVVICHKEFLEQRCKQRGVEVEEAMKSVVGSNGDILSIDTSHPSYPSRAVGDVTVVHSSPPSNRAPALNRGPGTELKTLLASVGIVSKPSCSCNARARLMDENEARAPGWCEQKIDEIVGWLREEATKRGLPFLDMAGRLLVKRAIRNARQKHT